MTTVKKHIKKVLILFLALVMCTGVLPLFGDTVPETEAATAGLYDIKVEVTVTNGADGWDKNNHTLYYKANNGTGTQSSQSVSLSTGNMDEEKTHTFTYTSRGFPTSYTYDYSFGGGLTWRRLVFDLKVSASKAGANDWKTVITAHFDDESGAFSAAKGTENWTASQNIPAVTSISWTPVTKNITVPKSGTATAATTAATVYDQYGVEWYQEPYYALHTGPTATTTSSTISGVTGTTSQANTCTVSVTNTAKTWVANGGGTSRNVYVTAYLNSVKTASPSTFSIDQVMYTVTFMNEGTQLAQAKWYYNETPSFQRFPTKHPPHSILIPLTDGQHLPTDRAHFTLHLLCPLPLQM